MDYLVRLNLIPGGNQTVRSKGKSPREQLTEWREDGVIKTKEDEGSQIFIPWTAIVAFEFDPADGVETVEKREEA